MEKRKKLIRVGICTAVGLFGALATALAIAAEVKRVRVDEVVVLGDDCFYPSSPAWALGIFAASSLLLSQIVATACGGCICCCTRKNSAISHSSQTTRTFAILCLVLSWVVFANAFFLLLEGAALNGQQQLRGQGMIYSCYIIKAGVFGAGAGLCVVTCGLAIAYYILATSAAMASPTFRVATHIHSHHQHVAAFDDPDYSFTSSRLPYVAGLELPKPFD